MGFLAQTRTLLRKNLLIILKRHWLSTLIRAFIAPIIFTFILAYAKNLFVPPSDFGVGSPTTLYTFADALSQTAGGRNTLPFVSNGLSEADTIIDQLSSTVRSQGLSPVRLQNDNDLLTTCKSSLRGTSACFAAVSFHNTPASGGSWNYTIRADGSFGTRIYVNKENNDAQIYVLPLQHAVDNAIAAQSGKSLPRPQQYAYTSQTTAERNRNITHLYMGTLISILGVAYFIGIIGICYQLTGFMATERELSLSQLLESMMPNRRRWQPQCLRLLAYHLSFDIVYLPSWIIIGAILGGLNYPHTGSGLMVGFAILAGLSLSSWSIAFASLFRKAQLSGITVTIVSIVLAIIVQVQTPTTSGAVVVVSLLFPPMNFTLFIIYMAYWEQQSLPADLSKACPSAPWRVPGYAFFIFTIIHIFVFPLLGAWLERVLHGTASNARTLLQSGERSEMTVQITDLTKTYVPNWFVRNVLAKLKLRKIEPVHAVQNLDLDIRKGELSVMLGANGSGKSTTMDMLAGLQAPTSGSIRIDGTGGVGICPQRNVLWDELTCLEHVSIFNHLKSQTPDKDHELRELLTACDLQHKIQARSKTLSGGQKRKLQLAMMLTGGSTLCLIDECSSGIDPLSRRKIWDILLAERGRRSMLFTTHFLDEAELLSDRIAVMSKGRLVARGTSVELKNEYGGGYRIKIYANESDDLSWAKYDKVEHADHVVYHVGDSTAAAAFIGQIEAHGIHGYRVLGPSIEDVFLKLASEAGDAQEDDIDGRLSTTKSNAKGLDLASGRRLSFPVQTWVLFRKRCTVLRRNYLPHVAAVLIPIIAAGLVTLFVKRFQRISCSPSAAVQTAQLNSLRNLADTLDIPAGPPDRVPYDAVALLYPNIAKPLHNVTTLADLEAYVSANYSSVVPGGFFIDATNPTFAWRGNYGVYFPVIIQNLLDSAQLGTLIQTAYQPFDLPFAPGSGSTLQFILYFGLAMCAYPGFFSLYPTMERKNNVRALHWSNGIRVLPLWLAYTLFDFLFVLLISAICTIIFAAAAGNAMYYLPSLFPVFFLYGLSAALLSYVVSLVVTSQLAAFATAAGYLCATFLLYFIAYLCIITYTNPASVDTYVLYAHFTIALISPSANLLRSLLLTFNEFSSLCTSTSLRTNPADILVFGGPVLYMICQALLLLGILVWYDSGYKPNFLRNKHKSTHVEDVDGLYDDAIHKEKARVEDCSDELRVNHVTKVFGDNLAVDDMSFGVPRGEIFALLGPNGAGKSTTISMIRGELQPSKAGGDILIRDVSMIKSRATARLNMGVCPQFDATDKMTATEHLRFYGRAHGISDLEHNVQNVIDAVGLRPFKDRMAAKLSGGNKRKLSLGIALIGNPSVLIIDEGSSGMDAAAKRVMWRTLRSVSAGRSLVISTHALEEADALADRVGIMAKRMLALGTSDSLRKQYGDAYYVHVVHKDAPVTNEDDMDAMKAWIREEFPHAQIEDRSFHGQIRFSVPNNRGSAMAPSLHSSSDDSKDHVNNSTIIKDDSVSNDHSSTHGNSILSLFNSLEANKQRLGMAFYAVSETTLDQVFLSIVSKHNVEEEGHQRAVNAEKVGLMTKVKRKILAMYHDA